MNHNAAEFYQSWPGKMGAMKAHAPDIGRSFSAMFQSLMKDSAAEGGLSVKQKELIALGIGIASRCDACIYSHVEKCLRAGATGKEVMDAAGVAVMMGGGPVFTYTTVVAAALDHLQSTPA
ncbi:MAG: carboxymuconolactone decarboxylase family protein [Phycisphaerales bacterium]|jgi:AhpD family alkylhydroperoxidase|nr:carboxymuconolactone decarboxylase family protein [Phycisphaeraceae bacterium]